MPRAIEGLEVRPGSDADIPAVIELMKTALGEGQIPRTREFWMWKHRENPFGPSPLWVAEKERRIVGARLFLRWRWQSRGRAANAVRAVDTATHPDFQGAGIFTRLTLGLAQEMTDAGVSFVFNTPNSKSRPGYLKMGWRAVGRIPLWVLPRRPLRLALRYLRGPDANDDQANDQSRTSGELERVLSELPATWSGTPPGVRYATPVDSHYLRWRYAACPAARYLAASVDPRQAFVVYRERVRSGLRELTLCDLFFERTRRGAKAAAASFELVLRRCASDYALAALRPDAWETAVLARAGFVPAPAAGPILTVRELAGWPDMPDPTKLLSWRASVGDLELF